MDFSYHRRTFRTVRILVSSTFLSRVSKVAIKVVCLRMEHRARLLKRTNAKDDHDDQAAADDDDADAIQTFTTIYMYMSPFQSVAVLALLYHFCRLFLCRRRIPTTVWKIRGWYEKSMVRIVHGTKSLWYEKSGSHTLEHSLCDCTALKIVNHSFVCACLLPVMHSTCKYE